jgi:hypothetical protein
MHDAQPVTAERVERALVLMAYIITRHGTKYEPIFDRLERELKELRRGTDVMSRAHALLESHTLPRLTTSATKEAA